MAVRHKGGSLFGRHEPRGVDAGNAVLRDPCGRDASLLDGEGLGPGVRAARGGGGRWPKKRPSEVAAQRHAPRGQGVLLEVPSRHAPGQPRNVLFASPLHQGQIRVSLPGVHSLEGLALLDHTFKPFAALLASHQGPDETFKNALFMLYAGKEVILWKKIHPHPDPQDGGLGLPSP